MTNKDQLLAEMYDLVLDLMPWLQDETPQGLLHKCERVMGRYKDVK